jgi:DNA-binding transcriptional regulator YhcF (GntR family)
MTNKEKIIEIMFNYPTGKFHIRELSRLSGLNPNTVSSIIANLERENIILRNKKIHIVEVSANLSSKEYNRKKRVWNFERIYSSHLVDSILDYFSVGGITRVQSVSVIGSYSQGEDIEKSDIDIVAISGEVKKKAMDVSVFEKQLKRRIHLIVTDYEKISEEFYINLINGMLLYGYLSKK